MALWEWTEDMPVTAQNLNYMETVLNNSAINEINSRISKMGKTLWEGSFSSGTISVPEISNYSLIGIYVGNVLMLGNQYYGGTTFATYAQLTTSTYAYRYTYNATNETLTIDSNNKGATNGSSSLTITKIIGLI